jgi:DNA sulfur modification protein DndB
LFVAHTPGKLAKTQLRFIRPQDSELRKYVDLALRFFGGLAKYFPELRRYFDSSSSATPKVVKRQRNASGGHILFRPVGLRIFAEITATLVKAACSLDVALKLMSELPTELSEKPYLRVVWLPGGTMNLKGRVVCRRLLLYMLGYERNPKELKQRYAELLGLEPAKVKLPGKLA